MRMKIQQLLFSELGLDKASWILSIVPLSVSFMACTYVYNGRDNVSIVGWRLVLP